MPTRAYRVAYDGAPYRGFQRQPDVPTVEDAVFDALRNLDVLADEARAKPPGYAAAGRTDAGVSAVAQTIAFDAPEWLAPRALNAELPGTIRAWAAADAPPDFHATHDAVEREYVYHLHAPPETIDDDRVERALDALSGPHDFHNLTPDDRNTERSPELAAARDGAFLAITVRAGGFPRELVRRLVSLVRSIGAGDAPFEKIDRTLSAEPLPGHEGVPPAPPDPLVLADVVYDDLEFRVDEEAAASARAAFESQRIDRATGARVSGALRDGVR